MEKSQDLEIFPPKILISWDIFKIWGNFQKNGTHMGEHSTASTHAKYQQNISITAWNIAIWKPSCFDESILALPTLLQFIHMCMKCADITSQNGQESHYLKNPNFQSQKSRDLETKNRDFPKFSKFRKKNPKIMCQRAAQCHYPCKKKNQENGWDNWDTEDTLRYFEDKFFPVFKGGYWRFHAVCIKCANIISLGSCISTPSVFVSFISVFCEKLRLLGVVARNGKKRLKAHQNNFETISVNFSLRRILRSPEVIKGQRTKMVFR